MSNLLPLESIKSFIQDGKLLWTMTTNGYKFYTWNLYLWCLSQTVKVKLCILCADTESSLFFRREGIPHVLLQGVKGSGQVGVSTFGTTSFAVWNRMKIDLLREIAEKSGELGLTTSLFLDGDIVLRENPWPCLQAMFEATGATLLFQCDCFHDKDEHTCSAACSGVIACNHKQEQDKVRWLFTFVQEEWVAADKQDQPYIQRRLERPEAPSAGILPRREFGNGAWQKSGKWKDDTWILLHYNYRVGDTKKEAMRAAGHWKLHV
jgi:hypothetical protein